MEIDDLKVGDTVRVISACHSYGRVGIVQKRYFCGNQKYATVKFENHNYKRSFGHQQGYNISSLEKINSIEKGEIEMEDIKDKDFVIVNVSKKGSNASYNYDKFFKCYDKNVKVGNEVIVEDDNSIYVVTDILIEFPKGTCVNKDVKCVLDYSTFNERKEKQLQIQRIKTKLDQKVKEIQKQIDYDYYASKDEEVKELLEEYNNLNS